MISCCFYSSFVFLMNSGLAGIHKYYTYSLLFALLFMTSLIVHSNVNAYTIALDKISIFAIVCYGGYLFTKKCISCNDFFYLLINMIFITSTFLLTIYLYYYGYLHKKYCYHPHAPIANLYHSFLHLTSFVGHTLIITM